MHRVLVLAGLVFALDAHAQPMVVPPGDLPTSR
jgi:hypothetical protein